jgi:hypothetical protein
MGMPKMSDEDKVWGAKATGALANSVTTQMEKVNALLAKMRPEDRAYIKTVKTPGNLLLGRLSRAEQVLLRAVDRTILVLGRQLDYRDLVHVLMDRNGPTEKRLPDKKLATRWRNCLRQHLEPDPERTRWRYPKMRLIGGRAHTYLGWYDKEFWYLLDPAYAHRRPNAFNDVYELVDRWLGLDLPGQVAEALVRFQKKAAELARHGISADQLTDVVRAEVARQRAAVPRKVSVGAPIVGIGRVWLGHEEIDRDVLEIGSINSARRRSRGRKSSNQR